MRRNFWLKLIVAVNLSLLVYLAFHKFGRYINEIVSIRDDLLIIHDILLCAISSFICSLIFAFCIIMIFLFTKMNIDKISQLFISKCFRFLFSLWTRK